MQMVDWSQKTTLTTMETKLPADFVASSIRKGALGERWKQIRYSVLRIKTDQGNKALEFTTFKNKIQKESPTIIWKTTRQGFFQRDARQPVTEIIGCLPNPPSLFTPQSFHTLRGRAKAKRASDFKPRRIAVHSWRSPHEWPNYWLL